MYHTVDAFEQFGTERLGSFEKANKSRANGIFLPVPPYQCRHSGREITRAKKGTRGQCGN